MLKKTLLLVIIILLSGLAPLACRDIVTGSGETQTFEMDYADFTRVEISTGFEMEIAQADSFYVSITIDKSLYEYLTIAKRGDTLHIGLKPNYTYTASSRQGTVYLPDLRRLELSGGSTAVVTGFTMTHAIDFELSGTSSMVLNPMQSGDASFVLSGGSYAEGHIRMSKGKLDVSGASTLKLNGTTTGLEVKASGASLINLDELPVGIAGVNLSGGSRATVNVSDTLNVKLDGGSDLTYIGNPKLGDMDISGGSKLNQAAP